VAVINNFSAARQHLLILQEINMFQKL